MIFQYFVIPISPIGCLLLAALGILLMDCLSNRGLHWLKWAIGVTGASISVVLSVHLWDMLPSLSIPDTQNLKWLSAFWKSYYLDTISIGFFLAIAYFTMITLILLRAYLDHGGEQGPICSLLLFAGTGAMLLVSARNLMIMFLALELFSLPTYVLVGFKRRCTDSLEAALKLFLFGSFASVLFIFGIALLYSQFATFDLSQIGNSLTHLKNVNVSTWAGFGLLFIAAGIKIGFVPFHMWIPDAYQGAPTYITGFLGSALKVAGFGLMLRVLWGPFSSLTSGWSTTLECIAVLSMFVGNISALVQNNLKRMFAYSSISHIGYILIGLTLPGAYGSTLGYLYYYLVVYGLMFLGLYCAIAVVEHKMKSSDIYQLSGMGFTHPVLSLCILLFVISAAGIPPTAVFMAKYFMFVEAVRAGKILLVLLALVSTLVGAYYHLRVVTYLYMKESKVASANSIQPTFAYISILLCTTSTLIFSVFPDILLGLF